MTNAALDAPLDINMPPSEEEPAKGNGVSYRDNWKAEVTDLMALVKAVAVGQAPVTRLKPDMTVQATRHD